jgi:hypothetical protein
MSHRSYLSSVPAHRSFSINTRAREKMLTLTCRHDVQLLALDFFATEFDESIFGTFATQLLGKHKREHGTANLAKI